MAQSGTPEAELGNGSGKRRLETFVAPKPSRLLIKALNPVNRIVCLGGVPVLRQVPGLRAVPGIRGLSNVTRIDLPDTDLGRLRSVSGEGQATFYTPNHPEFFTDWMIDKEVLSRVAPMAACWATHSVVNGLGSAAQAFWLKNNLIAQIPGAAGAEGRAHSVRWALQGHGVLLHPEGGVGWTSDWVAPLYPGAIEMAIAAHNESRAAGKTCRAVVAPVIWKLKFDSDVTADLSREMAYVERQLGLLAPRLTSNVAERVASAYAALLARDETHWGVVAAQGRPFVERQARLLSVLADRIRERTGLEAHPDHSEFLRNAERWLRTQDPRADHNAAEVRGMVTTARRVLRFQPAVYTTETLTQEHVAENIKRLRNDYCTRGLRDAINRFVPQPVGPRVAHIRVPEPVDVSAFLGTRSEMPREEIAALAEDVRRRMQMAIDDVNTSVSRKTPQPVFPNPFREA